MVEFREGGRSDGASVLWVEGEFDLAVVDQFLEQALACLGRADALEIDLEAVTFIDSSGLVALVRMLNEGVAQGKTVCLVNVGPPTHRLLEITGLHDAFDIRPTQA